VDSDPSARCSNHEAQNYLVILADLAYDTKLIFVSASD